MNLRSPIVLYCRLKPLPNCKHGQKEIKKWWQLDYLLCGLECFTVHGLRWLKGGRLWIYTIKGGIHFDVYFQRPIKKVEG